MSDAHAIDRIDDLTFQVDKSMRYHQRMRGFYDMVNRVFLFIIIASGGGAATDKPEHFVIAASIVAAILLVWSPAVRARDHHLLHGQFSRLMMDIRSGEPTKQNHQAWEARRIEIEMQEPPIFYALEADCDNQVRRAWGRTSQMVDLGWWHRHTMYLWRHDHVQFPLKHNLGS